MNQKKSLYDHNKEIIENRELYVEMYQKRVEESVLEHDKLIEKYLGLFRYFKQMIPIWSHAEKTDRLKIEITEAVSLLYTAWDELYLPVIIIFRKDRYEKLKLLKKEFEDLQSIYHKWNVEMGFSVNHREGCLCGKDIEENHEPKS